MLGTEALRKDKNTKNATGNTTKQYFGKGIEAEAFIVSSQDKELAVPRIESAPSAEWIINLIKHERPKLADLLGLEQASVMLELRTGIHPSFEKGIEEVMTLRKIINDLLKLHGQDAELRFAPVLEKPFEFVEATTREDSNSHRRVEEWGAEEQESKSKVLLNTATASFQLNDSTMFRNIETKEDCFHMGRMILNSMRLHVDTLLGLNEHVINHDGKTREEIARALLLHVKQEKFEHSPFSVEEALIPPVFKTNEQFKDWLACHSGLTLEHFQDALCKNVHSFIAKLKWPDANSNIFAIETRYANATESVEKMKEHIRAFEKIKTAVALLS